MSYSFSKNSGKVWVCVVLEKPGLFFFLYIEPYICHFFILQVTLTPTSLGRSLLGNFHKGAAVLTKYSNKIFKKQRALSCEIPEN